MAAAYHAELLETAEHLVSNESVIAGPLSSALIRRSISTCYYALFHFLLDDACRRLVRIDDTPPIRRRILIRSFTHAGVKSALNKVRGKAVDRSLADFLRPTRATADTKPPDFARFMASIFIDAQAQRHSADYDLNVAFSATDAHELRLDCREAIQGWQSATKDDEVDFKDALAIVMLLKGQLRLNDQDAR